VLSADGPAAVRVEDFRLEDHYVEVNPGELPKSQPCLVIRLAYSKKDRPFFVDPASLNALNVPITGYEHRYYSRAGKYAGLFWPVNASMFDVLRGGKFGLVSLTKLRGDAEKHRQKLEIKLGRPSDHTEFPEPPRIIAE
jgi:hypothetical protein